MGLKENVINTLMSPPMKWVNFKFSNWGIQPFGFCILATYVNDGRIGVKVNHKLTDRATYDPVSNTIFARDHSFGATYWDEKSTLVHESAHAMLDCLYAGKNSEGRSASMRVVDDETIGYLAGAIYLLASGSANISSTSKGDPNNEALKAARPKLNEMKARGWDGCYTMDFSTQDVRNLQAAIKAHAFYKADWNHRAVHNGIVRT